MGSRAAREAVNLSGWWRCCPLCGGQKRRGVARTGLHEGACAASNATLIGAVEIRRSGYRPLRRGHGAVPRVAGLATLRLTAVIARD